MSMDEVWQQRRWVLYVNMTVRLSLSSERGEPQFCKKILWSIVGEVGT